MGINIELYRAVIGRFHFHVGRKSLFSSLFFWHIVYPNFIFLNWVLPNILKQCNDIESNPGPVQGSSASTNTSPTPHHFEIGHINMRSVKAPAPDPNQKKSACTLTKMDLLKSDMTFRNYSILGISETWLDDSYDASKLNVKGYHPPFRRDNTAHSCGSMLYIAANTPAQRKQLYEPPDSEIICVELRIKKVKILVSSCYRPQHRDMIDFCSDIESILDAATQDYQSFIFLGDMNARNKQFWEGDLTNTEGRAIKAFFDSHNFDQLIHEPTRILGDAKSCIDLIFTNNPSIVSSVGTRPKIYTTCDHKPIYATLKSTFSKPHSYTRYVWNYQRDDMEKFQYSLLETPWRSCYIHNDFDDVIQSWMNLFVATAESAVPHYATTIRPRDKDFMNSTIRHLMLERDRLHKLIKVKENDTLKSQYKAIRNRVVAEIGKSKFEKEKKLNISLSSVDVSSKKWWHLYKSTMNRGDSISINNTSLLDGNHAHYY
jgi:hypothetical protein